MLWRNVPRGIAILGVLLAMGPGYSIPNNFDMIWRLAGVLVMTVGVLSMLGTLRAPPEEDSENDKRTGF